MVAHANGFIGSSEHRATLPRPVVQLDTLDFEILREMFLGSALHYRSERVSFDAVARKLGVHRKTVAARAKRLAEAGLGLPLTIAVDPASLGTVRGKAFLRGGRLRSDEMIESLRHIEGLQLIMTYSEGVDVIIHAEDDGALDTRAELARDLTHGADILWEMRSARDFPAAAARYQFSRLDLHLLAELVVDARAPFPAMARRLGVTARTLERRFERMAREGVVTVLPAGDGHSRFAGVTVTMVLLTLHVAAAERPKVLGEILHLLPNHFVRNLIPSGSAHLFVYSSSAAELDDQLVAARGIPGVASVTSRTVTWIGANPRYPAWLQSVLERRLADRGSGTAIPHLPHE